MEVEVGFLDFFVKIFSIFLSFRPRPSPFSYMLSVFVISVGLNGRKLFELKSTEDGTDYETSSMMEFAPYLVRKG